MLLCGSFWLKCPGLMRLNQKRALAEADAFQMKEAPPGLAERGFRFAILRFLTN
jgi:hypothetical protein